MVGVEARIVDMETGTEAPWDGTATGELQVRQAHLVPVLSSFLSPSFSVFCLFPLAYAFSVRLLLGSCRFAGPGLQRTITTQTPSRTTLQKTDISALATLRP